MALVPVGLASASSTPPEGSYWGRPVVDVRLECDARISFENFARKIVQKVGEPLEPGKVAESLKNLYSSGRFVDLRAEAEPAGSGVALIFLGRAQYFVGTVRVEGNPKPIDPRVLVAASRLRLGQPHWEEETEEAAGRLTAVLAENGYYQARVGHRVLENADNQEAEVVFSLVPGEPARLSGVELEGHTAVAPERLKAVAGWRVGQHVTAARLERSLFKIHQFYVRNGRPQANASLLKRIYDPRGNTEKLLVQIEAGPLVKLRVEGVRLSSSKIKELIPVFSEGITDDAALARGQTNLQSNLERQGYYSSQVYLDRKFHPDPPTLEVKYTVTPGRRGEFIGYAFRGNHAITTADLHAVLGGEPKSVFHPHGVFTRPLLARDLDALRALYQSRGFLSAGVTPRLTDPSQDRSGRLLVTFDIEEGPRSLVRQLRLLEVNGEAEKDFWGLLVSKPGQPYSPGLAQKDRDAILSYLADRGYAHASASWAAAPVPASHEVDLEFRIDPGSAETVRRVVVMGNEHTHSGIIRRELLIRPGEPMGQSALVESQRRLYELGVFNQVQMAPQDPQGSETEKTVLVSVEEARRWTLGYGGGFEVQRLGSNQPQGQFKASPRLSFDLTRLNVRGRTQTLTLRGRLSTLDKGGAISYFVPRLAGRRDLGLRLGVLVDRSRDVLTFASKRREASLGIERRFSSTKFLLGRFSFRRVEVSDVRIRAELIPILSRSARVAMLDLSYASDRRDDLTDPTRGSNSLANSGISWDKLGSQANFLRFSGQNSTYYPLGPHLIFARSTRLAVEPTFSELNRVVNPGVPAGESVITREIPLPERFFMGGSDSHRGFSINQAGPRDPGTGFPIGGKALFLNTLELRMPLVEKRIGFVVFHDAGNVYSTVRRMRLLKVTQSSPTNFDYTSHALGLGVRYKTPVGPIRFDVGYNLNPPRFQISGPAGIEVQRLSQFQFFLSVGQSF